MANEAGMYPYCLPAAVLMLSAITSTNEEGVEQREDEAKAARNEDTGQGMQMDGGL